MVILISFKFVLAKLLWAITICNFDRVNIVWGVGKT